jgi:hypothetical protein
MARVLDPAYLDGIETRSDDDLHALHDECTELENEVSFVRRLAQARIDILEAETDRRARGGSLGDLVERLPEILADAGPRQAPAASRLPLRLTPEHDSEWAPELAEFDGPLASLPSLTDAQLRDAIDGLRRLERDVSDERRRLHGVIDRIERVRTDRLG